MNILARDEWFDHYRLRNYGTPQEQLDAAEWLREYAYQHIHDLDPPDKKDEKS